MIEELNILITGVGGQGVILMSELLGQAAIEEGLKVRGSEILGMAVRGGPVVSVIRIGDGVFGPLIPEGKCDIMVGMELAEALRNIAYLSKSSLAVVNSRKILPYTVSLGLSPYPSYEQSLEKLKEAAGQVVVLDGDRLAREAGSLLSANIVMLGALLGTGRVPIKPETLKEAIKERFPRQAEINLKAFELGYTACRQGAGKSS
ncbi:MAG: indolepyruvate ferredoxin oxidoreductase subunit beta [Chloroflexi bacterium]|nr:MAG: indolepyruvate ferredoxin oxidoreductase subunit beta [Chloroflexota bacterium]